METTKTIIMRRVTRIYHMRRALALLTAKPLWLMALAVFLAKSVSVADVLKNRPAWSSVSENFSFWSYAITHTGYSVQLMVILSVAVGLFFVRDLVKLSFRGDLSFYRVN